MAENCTGGTIAYINFDNQTGAHHPGEDAEFIAHAREDVPQLLSLIDRMGEALEKIKERHTPNKFGRCLACGLDGECLEYTLVSEVLHSLQAEGREA